ncbi:hypothetical protein OESDEN_14988 [Oesophagostomum dentatum]|uniref:Uncharacterized protein n=1 Tax=Oesophagostomum dentatum TaxID=61180 RepID=A0A0B1SK31_OESDE|nr:hypothetical protein OESDEN_14988 [Oesophagostomum dentatum]
MPISAGAGQTTTIFLMRGPLPLSRQRQIWPVFSAHSYSQ